MTEYEILTNLPRTHYFGDWDKKDIRAFGKWFMAEKDNRLQMLFDEIHRDPEFANWEPDFSPESLKTLSYWFERFVRTNVWSLPENEWQELLYKKKNSMSSIEICNNKFVTSKSTSLIFDVSIYWGEVLLQELGDRQWEQNMKTSKNDMFYGYMIIPVIPTTKFNCPAYPWAHIRVLSCKVLYTNNFEEEGLYKFYLQKLNYFKEKLLVGENK